MFSVAPKETVSMVARDGVRLDADLYRPRGEGPFPVLLMRQPYGRAIASTVVYAHPTWYAAHGYIVVIQDVRGRGTSEDVFHLFAHEVEDGFDSVNWAANLPGSTGTVGMYGFSYQGMTQFYAASARPAALKVLCPAMVGCDLYGDWAYEGGAFCLQANLGWAIQLAAETARLRGDAIAFQKLYRASRNLPLHDPVPTRPAILQTLAPDSFYHEWLAHPEPDEYWAQRSPDLRAVDLPMLHIGGWFDPYLRGTLHLYRAMANRSTRPQHLLVGPWGHIPWGRCVGVVDFGPEAVSPVDQLQRRWFDQFLKGIDTGILTEKSVRLFEMGSNRWQFFQTWPNRPCQSYFLASTGLASVREDAGRLTQRCPDSCSQDVIVHDPWRPVPALGGHASLPSGCFDRASIDCRADVLTYTSAPLRENLHLVGAVTVAVFCTADAPSFDLCAVLSEVHPGGSVFNITQGYGRVKPEQSSAPLHITLQPTCAQVATGNALRLSLSAACFPAYPVNPGTGAQPEQASLGEARIITLSVQSGGDRPSQVRLPEC